MNSSGQTKENQLFIAIDANAIIHRAFHAFPPNLTNRQGVPLNAVFGFTSMLLTIIHDFKPKYIACAFDTATPTLRHSKFVDYKAHRKPTEKILSDQFPLVERVVQSLNIPIIKKDGYEADDVLGTLSKMLPEMGEDNLKMLIITGDRDLLQLINDDVNVALPKGGFKNLTAFDREKMIKEYGYAPEQVIEYKALVGDASDNIPGVNGIGEKGALSMLKDYGNIEGLYKNLDKLTPRYAKLLQEGEESAVLSRELATIITDMDFEFKLDSCLMRDFDHEKVVALFMEYEFRSLVGKIPHSYGNSSQRVALKSAGQVGMFGEGAEEVKSLGADSKGQEAVKAVDDGKFTEIDAAEFIKGLDASSLKVVAHLCNGEVVNGDFILALDAEDRYALLSADETVGLLRTFKSQKEIKPEDRVIFYGWETLMGKIEIDSRIVNNFLDVQIFEHVLSAGSKAPLIANLAGDLLGLYVQEKFSSADISPILSTVQKIGQRQVEISTEEGRDPKRVFNLLDVEQGASIMIGKMERKGIRIDTDYLENLKWKYENELKDIERRIYDSVGYEFNVRSTKQLATALFDDLKLGQSLRQRKRSTREEILRMIEVEHPVIPLILEYRELSKVQSTYVEPFLALARTEADGKIIHTDFQQMGASSGRLSSTNPNMQNIPIRGRYASEIREAFIPRDGYCFVSVDYSQIEFRLMAHVSEDKLVIADLKAGKDIHQLTAARIFGKDEKDVTKQDRSRGKTVNFGILYGQTKYGLSRLMKISHDEANDYITKYFENYSGVKAYLEKAGKEAEDRGYAESEMGRRRYIPGLRAQNRMVKEAAVREAINMPIQGGNADLMKSVMVEIDLLIEKKYEGEVFPLLQIHDELIFEVKKGKEKAFTKEVVEMMENHKKFKVPIVANSAYGNNMNELK